MYDDIAFWPRICSGHLLIDLETLGPKMFQNKDGLFAPTVTPGKWSEGNATTLVLQNHGDKRDCFEIIAAVPKDEKNIFIVFCCHLCLKTEQPKSSRIRNPGFQKFWKPNSKIPEHENSCDHQRAFKEWKMLGMTLNKVKTFDSKLQEQTMKERQIWRQFLIRLFDVVKFLNRICL